MAGTRSANTFTMAVTLWSPASAVIRATPLARVVTLPSASTEATESSEDFQVSLSTEAFSGTSATVRATGSPMTT